MKQINYFKKAHELAASAGTTVAQLCLKAGIAKSTVTQWKDGKQMPTLRTWGKLEHAAELLKKRLAKVA